MMKTSGYRNGVVTPFPESFFFESTIFQKKTAVAAGAIQIVGSAWRRG
jgi:hypothetical protein